MTIEPALWLSKETGRKARDIVKEFHRFPALIPLHYVTELKEGRPIRDVMISIINAAILGQDLETKMRSALKLNGLLLDEANFEVEYSENAYWLHYEVPGWNKSPLNSIDITCGDGGDSLELVSEKIFSRRPDKKLLEEAIMQFNEKELFDCEYSFEYDDDLDFSILRLTANAEDLESLPNLDAISEQFKAIVRKATGSKEKIAKNH